MNVPNNLNAEWLTRTLKGGPIGELEMITRAIHEPSGQSSVPAIYYNVAKRSFCRCADDQEIGQLPDGFDAVEVYGPKQTERGPITGFVTVFGTTEDIAKIRHVFTRVSYRDLRCSPRIPSNARTGAWQL